MEWHPAGRGKRMKRTDYLVVCNFIVILLLLTGASTRAQEPNQVPSLGEIARHLKTKHEKEKQAPVPVFTNDNLPSRDSGGISTLKATEGAHEKPMPGKSEPATTENKVHGERYFRSKANKIRAQMEFHKRQLAVLQQQLGLARMQYYPDPQKTLEQESTPAFQSDLDKLHTKIAAAEKAVVDDQKAMDKLQEQLRQEGGDPGWIR
jgi:hypothetical protein